MMRIGTQETVLCKVGRNQRASLNGKKLKKKKNVTSEQTKKINSIGLAEEEQDKQSYKPKLKNKLV